MSKILVWFKSIQIYFFLAIIIVAFFFGDSYGVNRAENSSNKVITKLEKEISDLKLKEAQKETKIEKNINDNRKFQNKVIDKTKDIDVNSRRELLLRIFKERDSK